MILIALQFLLAHACKCQVMLSTVQFPLTSPKRSTAKDGMKGGKQASVPAKGLCCMHTLASLCNICSYMQY